MRSAWPATANGPPSARGGWVFGSRRRGRIGFTTTTRPAPRSTASRACAVLVTVASTYWTPSTVTGSKRIGAAAEAATAREAGVRSASRAPRTRVPREPRRRAPVGAPWRRHEARDGEARERPLVRLERRPEALGRDPIGEEGGDERARAAADVEVEVAGRETLAHRVEREQRPHLVEAPHDPAAGEHERPPGRPLPPAAHDNPREISAAGAPSVNCPLWYN